MAGGDPLGLVILVHKQHSDDGVLLDQLDAFSCRHFRHQALDLCLCGIVHLVNSWINAEFIHRGMITLVLNLGDAGGCGNCRVLLGTAHLQTVVINPFRLSCIREM